MTRAVAFLLLIVSSWSSACGGSSQRAEPPPPASAPVQQSPSAPAAQPGAPHVPQPQPYPPHPTYPTAPAPTVPAAPSSDPISTVQLVFLRQRAQDILSELVAALPAGKQQRVLGIPLVVDDTPGVVNAFAACSQGRSAMAITDGLLQIQAGLAQAQAHDEAFGTRAVDGYVQTLAASLRPNQPVAILPPALVPNASDPRVVARQHQVFDEQVAFVLGHELGHHHLSHLPCTAAPDPLGAAEAGRILSSAVPLFNQPNEVAADLAGTYNVLDAGRARGARGGFVWTEGGGLLTMRFFAGLSRSSPADVLTAFERSHPPPELRTPIIQQAASVWRSTGGAPFPIPGF